MNGYYLVLTTIDLFVLSFMGLLTRLSESLNKKQKRGFFLAFALIAGISEEKKETQYFLERLWCGVAMPAELNALYDDYIGEKEWQDDRGIYAAC